MSNGVQKRKAWTARSVFRSPFSTSWPQIEPSCSARCLEILREVFQNPSAVPSAPNTSEQGEAPEEKIKDPKEIPGKRKKRRRGRDKPPGLVFGLNEVTKAIERGQLEVAVVCKDTQPHLLVRHVPVLCYIGGVKLVGMVGGGADLGAVFGLKKLIGVGFLKKEEGGAELVELSKRLKDIALRLEFPWLNEIEFGGWREWTGQRDYRLQVSRCMRRAGAGSRSFGVGARSIGAGPSRSRNRLWNTTMFGTSSILEEPNSFVRRKRPGAKVRDWISAVCLSPMARDAVTPWARMQAIEEASMLQRAVEQSGDSISDDAVEYSSDDAMEHE